jgi:hypothetical protein
MDNARMQQPSYMDSSEPIIYARLARDLMSNGLDSYLLINSNQYGIQHKQLNQRQKRKQARQSNRINS